MYEEGGRGLLPGSPHTKRRLRRGTASTVSEGETPRRDALHDLIAESEVSFSWSYLTFPYKILLFIYLVLKVLTNILQKIHPPQPRAAPYSSLHGSTHSINSDTNITSVSDTWQSEPGPHMSSRMMYGTNKLKMVKPMEGSMTLLQV